jgi:hypothetical protein
VLGTSGSRLHVGARRGDTYIDPESLWGPTGPPWVRLAPLDGVAPRVPSAGGGRRHRPPGSPPAGAIPSSRVVAGIGSPW